MKAIIKTKDESISFDGGQFIELSYDCKVCYKSNTEKTVLTSKDEVSEQNKVICICSHCGHYNQITSLINLK